MREREMQEHKRGGQTWSEVRKGFSEEGTLEPRQGDGYGKPVPGRSGESMQCLWLPSPELFPSSFTPSSCPAPSRKRFLTHSGHSDPPLNFHISFFQHLWNHDSLFNFLSFRSHLHDVFYTQVIPTLELTYSFIQYHDKKTINK